jgi:hypothetical protein
LLRRPFESSEYAADLYRQALADYGLLGSMGRRGNPCDNAKAESFMKTLKSEHVYLNEYRSYKELVERLPEFIGQVYNTRRLHSALGYLPPVQFEQRHTRQLAQSTAWYLSSPGLPPKSEYQSGPRCIVKIKGGDHDIVLPSQDRAHVRLSPPERWPAAQRIFFNDRGCIIGQCFKDQPITLFDATVAVLAQRTGLRVWTYDHHFDVMRAPIWRWPQATDSDLKRIFILHNVNLDRPSGALPPRGDPKNLN